MGPREGRAASLLWLDSRMGRLARRLDGIPARRFARRDDIAVRPSRFEGDHRVMTRPFRPEQLERMPLLDLLVGDNHERDDVVVSPANMIERTQGVESG